MNRTYIAEKDEIKKRIILMRTSCRSSTAIRYPIQRRVIEERARTSSRSSSSASNTSSTRTTSSRGSSWT